MRAEAATNAPVVADEPSPDADGPPAAKQDPVDTRVSDEPGARGERARYDPATPGA